MYIPICNLHCYILLSQKKFEVKIFTICKNDSTTVSEIAANLFFRGHVTLKIKDTIYNFAYSNPARVEFLNKMLKFDLS